MKPVLFEKITYAVAEIAKMLGISKGAAQMMSLRFYFGLANTIPPILDLQ